MSVGEPVDRERLARECVVPVACPICGYDAGGDLDLVDRYATDYPSIPWCDIRQVVRDPEEGNLGFCPGCDEELDPDTVVERAVAIDLVGWSRRTGRPGYPFSYGYATSRGHRRERGSKITLCGINIDKSEALNLITGDRAAELEPCKRCEAK